MEVEEDPENPSLILVQVANEAFPVLALGQVDDLGKTFGNALKSMLKTKSDQILVVTFIVEIPPDWEDVERFGIHVMNPNDALEGLRRLSEGKSLSPNGGNSLYF